MKAVGRALRDTVRQRAHDACEYCGFPEAFSELRFVIDHIVARQHNGQTISENLAYCCPFCNSRKGPNLTGIDPQTGGIARLFNPRTDAWKDHFRGADAVIVPLTAIGRATVAVLEFNHPDQLDPRHTLVREGKMKFDQE